MSYSVDIELDHLTCRTKAMAFQAAALLLADSWASGHLEVSPSCGASPERDDAWHLAIDNYDACYWSASEYGRVWLALAPFMADGAFIEFRSEDASRFRVRWEGGRVFEDYPTKVIWGDAVEITPELLSE